jgi:WD40 repeat protein
VYDRANWTAGRELKSGVTFNRPTTLTYLTGGRLLLGGHSPDVRVWNVAGDRLAARLEGDGLTSWLTSVSPDGRWVTCGSEDGKIRVWKLPDAVADPMRK